MAIYRYYKYTHYVVLFIQEKLIMLVKDSEKDVFANQDLEKDNNICYTCYSQFIIMSIYVNITNI